MDLTALNRSPIGAAARAVGRVSIGALSGVASTAGVLSGAIFRSGSAWQLLLNRTRFDYRAEVGDPATNSIVGAVVGWLTRNFAEAPVRIVREGTTEIAYGPAGFGPGAMLRLLERPNRYYSGVLQWMATIVDWIIDGNAYWFKVRNDSGRVVELWWLPAQMVEPRWPVKDPSVFISYYEYMVDGVAYGILPSDIVHFRNGINPRNPRKGLSKLHSLLREIFTDDEAANFTASLLRNLGVPGVIIAPANTTGGAVRTDPAGIKQKFKEAFGGDARGEPMVLTGPSDVKVLSFNPQEMDLKGLRRIPEERIAAVLGVPVMVAQLGAGLERSSFTNYETASVVAYTQGVISDHRLFAAELEVQLLTEFADLEREALDVWFDWTKVSAMVAAIAELWKRLEGPATKGLMTRKRYKEFIGEPVTDDDDVYVMPNNYVVVPVGGIPPPTGFNRPALPTNGSALAATQPLLIGAAPSEAGEVRCEGCGRLLAEQAGTPYRFTCRYCKVLTASVA